MDTKARERALVIALLASLVLWNLPFGGLVLYPFKLLATWMHELSHGLVMLAVGAGFDHLEIYRDTSGMAFARYGVGAPGAAAIAAAGYMGTPLFGALFLLLGQTRRGARGVLAAIGGLLVLSAVFAVRGGFGVGFVVTAAAVFLVAAAFAPPGMATFLVNFVAAQACINALLDIRVLFGANLVVNGRPMGASDAHSMAEATFGPPWMWAVIWLVWAFGLLYVALRVVYLQRDRPIPTPVTAAAE